MQRIFLYLLIVSIQASTLCGEQARTWFIDFFSDSELQQLLCETSEERFAPILLNTPDTSRERFLTLYLRRLQALESGQYKERAGSLFKQFLSALEKSPECERKKLSDPFYKLVESLTATFNWVLDSKIEVQSVGKIPLYNYPFLQFSKIAEQAMSGDVALMVEQEQTVHAHAQKNPEMRRAIQEFEKSNKKGYPYSIIQAGCSPKMVIIGTPRSDRQDTVNRFFQVMLEQNVTLIVALNTPSDWDKAIAYYTEENLRAVRINGKTISCIEEKELYCGKVAANLPSKERQKLESLPPNEQELFLLSDELECYRPRIIERTFQVSDGRKITHLQYLQWPDRSAATDLDALLVLVTRQMQVLKNEPGAIGIHCQGGIGRTNYFAILTWLLFEIESMHQKGVDVDEAIFNIPEMMYQLKKQAVRLGGHISGLRFGHIYFMADAYYKTLRIKI